MQTKEELNLADTIKGEINRMCVTDDIVELDTMTLHARRNIERLQSLRYASITADTPQTDLPTEEFVEGMKNLRMEVKQTDCDRYVVINDEGERAYNCIGCQTDCPWK